MKKNNKSLNKLKSKIKLKIYKEFINYNKNLKKKSKI